MLKPRKTRNSSAAELIDTVKLLHKVLFASGLIFLAVLIWRLGVRELWRQFTLLGWGLLPIILAEGASEFCHAVSWRFCLGHQHRRMSLLRLFHICMAGYAISFLTPTASLGGEVTKGALLTSPLKGPHVVTALLVGKVSFALSHLSFVVIGFVTVLWHVPLPPAVKTALLIGSALLMTGIVAFLLVQKHGKLGGLLRWLARRSKRLHALQKLSHSMNEIDDALKRFYQERPWDLVLSVVWHWIGYSFGIFSTWFFLWAMSGPPSAEVAAGIWFLALWFDLVTFAVPLNLGTLEGSRLLIFQAFHLGSLTGMTFGLATRASQLIWVAYGMVSYALLIADRNGRDTKTATPVAH